MEASDLASVLSRIQESYRKLTEYELQPGTDEYKRCLLAAIASAEAAQQKVRSLALFSANETLEDLATGDIKYLTLPALLGHLLLLCSSKQEERKQLLCQSKLYLEEFIERCQNYQITSEEPPLQEDPSVPAHIKKAVAQRQSKIARHKLQKELEAKVKELDQRVASRTQGTPVDEDVQRELSLSHTRLWLHKTKDALSALETELTMLSDIDRMRDSHGEIPKPQPDPTSRPPMKPFVLTREMVKEKVFGAGYPSLPTYSLEEFVQQRYGDLQAPAQSSAPHGQRTRDAEGEGEEGDKESDEEESEEKLKKAREWDEFKDDNKRGSGNQKNMG